MGFGNRYVVMAVIIRPLVKASTDKRQLRMASRELREAVAYGPILLRGIVNHHEQVLRADAAALAEQLRNPPYQLFVLCGSARVEHGTLDILEIVASGNPV